MKKVIRSKFSYLLMTGIVILFSACHDSKDPDTKSPELSVEGILENQTVRGTLIASIQATDNDKIDKVDVFIDGDLLTTLTASPYEVTWDSNDVADGPHVIKIVATDKSGNEKAVSINLVVKNVLLTVHAGIVESGYRNFIFLSDENGKFLTGKEISSNETFSLKDATFTEEIFYLTEVEYYTNGSQHYTKLWTFTDIAQGEWYPLSTTAAVHGPASVGTANLAFFIKPTDDLEYSVEVNGRNSDQISKSKLSTALNLFEPTGYLYVERYNPLDGGSRAYNIFPIATGNNATINLSNTVNLPFNTVTAKAPDNASDCQIYLTGGFGTKILDNEFPIGTFNMETDKSITVEYPGSAFPFYYAETKIDFDSYAFTSGIRGFYDVTPFEHALTFKNTTGKIEFSATGNFDYVSFDIEDKNNEDNNWYFLTHSGSGLSIFIPEIPSFITGITTFNFSNTNLNATLDDQESIKSYDDLTTMFRTGDGFSKFELPTSNYKTIDVTTAKTGGRKASPVKKNYKSSLPFKFRHFK